MKQIELDFDVKRQKTFTLDDVDLQNDINLNVTFIDKQEELEQALNWLKFEHKEIGLDIETRGLDPHQHELIMLQFGDLHRQFVIDTRVVDVSTIIPYIINKETTIVGQNLKFEYKFIKHNYNILLEDIKDTMIQEKILYNGLDIRYNLKDLAKRYLNYVPDKTIRERFLTIGDKPFSKDEIIYGAYDVILPLLISAKQEEVIKKESKGRLAKLEHEVVKVFGDIEYKGLYFDKKKWETLYNDNLPIYRNAEEVLNKYIIDNNFTKYIEKQQDLFSSNIKTNISWSSPKQVVEFFNFLGICPKVKDKQTKKMKYSVESKVLKTSLVTINKDKPKDIKQFIKDYISYSEQKQKITTFGLKFFKHINPETNRLHSNYNQIINTGRVSSSGPNLQNIPSAKRFRQCFTAPEGYKIINADFSGQENVILANKSMDKDLLEFYDKGNSDMHSFIASKIFKINYDEFIKAVKDKDNKVQLTSDQLELLSKRGIAKAAGFAINYGGTGFTIAENLGISPEEGDEVYEAYFKAFPGLRKYFDDVIAKTLKDGYILINDLSNRTFRLKNYDRLINYSKRPDKKREFNTLKSAISRTALNYPVQGTAGDITKSATVKFRRWLIENNLHNIVNITNVVHDEINVECPTSMTTKVAKALENSMAQAGKVWCKRVPLKAVAAIGDYWAH